MLTFLLKLLRISALIVWFVFCSIPASIIFIGGWKAIKRAVWMTSIWAKGITKIINLRIKIAGNILPAKGSLIVSNHLSYLDILAHSAVFMPRFTPKSSVSKWPVLGQYLNLSRPIWIDRDSRQASVRALGKFRETLEHKINLLVYPEGTSSNGSSGVLPFKSTSFESVIGGNYPIFPILTIYRQNPGEPTVCWFGKMTLLGHIWQIIGLKSINIEIHILPPVFSEGKKRKELAVYIHSIMNAEYKKIKTEICA